METSRNFWKFIETLWKFPETSKQFAEDGNFQPLTECAWSRLVLFPKGEFP